MQLTEGINHMATKSTGKPWHVGCLEQVKTLQEGGEKAEKQTYSHNTADRRTQLAQLAQSIYKYLHWTIYY